MGFTSALEWLRTHQLECGALPVSSTDPRPYPEVTGYCLPTLWQAGQRSAALRGVEWLLDCQRREGSWPGPDMVTPYWFDTAIVTGSLLSLPLRGADCSREAMAAVERAARWLAQDCVNAFPPIQTRHHDPGAPAEINLLGAAMLSRYPILKGALDAWTQVRTALSCSGKMQHFYCYCVEAMAIARRPLARRIADQFARAQDADGSVAAYYDDGGIPGEHLVVAASWRCFPAIAQWAALWAGLGHRAAATRAIQFLESRQASSGGFVGGDGPYFPDQELTWAVKYYLDACLLMDHRS